jgi:hypothetical protein
VSFFDQSSRLAPFDPHLLRGVQELTSNTAEPLVSRETGTANYPADVAVSRETDGYIALRVRSYGEIPVPRETERALDGFRWVRANHIGRRPDCRWLDFWRVVSPFHVLPLRDFWSHMGVPRETKCIVSFLTRAADWPLLAHIY